MKDKNLNILNPRTSNPLLYIIYNFYTFITIWFIYEISPWYYFLNMMSQNFESLPPFVTQCHTSSTLSVPLNVWHNLWMPPNSASGGWEKSMNMGIYNSKKNWFFNLHCMYASEKMDMMFLLNGKWLPCNLDSSSIWSHKIWGLEGYRISIPWEMKQCTCVLAEGFWQCFKSNRM